jgi:hypothetical protein
MERAEDETVLTYLGCYSLGRERRKPLENLTRIVPTLAQNVNFNCADVKFRVEMA